MKALEQCLALHTYILFLFQKQNTYTIKTKNKVKKEATREGSLKEVIPI